MRKALSVASSLVIDQYLCKALLLFARVKRRYRLQRSKAFNPSLYPGRIKNESALSMGIIVIIANLLIRLIESTFWLSGGRKPMLRALGAIMMVFGFIFCLTLIGAVIGIPMMLIGMVLVLAGGGRRTVVVHVTQNAPHYHHPRDLADRGNIDN
jgi:hypothetical protein